MLLLDRIISGKIIKNNGHVDFTLGDYSFERKFHILMNSLRKDLE